MPPKLLFSDSGGTPRSKRHPASAEKLKKRTFLPGETAALLGLSKIDYRQLRRLAELIATDKRRLHSRKWMRFTFRDLIALKVALAIGLPKQRKRIDFRLVARVIEVLRKRGKSNDPLVELPLRRVGRVVIAQLESGDEDAVSGQKLIPGLLDAIKQSGRVLRLRPAALKNLEADARALLETRLAQVKTVVLAGA